MQHEMCAFDFFATYSLRNDRVRGFSPVDIHIITIGALRFRGSRLFDQEPASLTSDLFDSIGT